MEENRSLTWADIREARLMGRAPRSVVAVRLVTISAVFLCCAFAGPRWLQSVIDNVRGGFRAGTVDFDVLLSILYSAGWACGTTAVVAVLCGILFAYIHTGFLWSLSLVTPSLSRRYEVYERVCSERWSFVSSVVALVLVPLISILAARLIVPESVRLLNVSVIDLVRITCGMWRFCFVSSGVLFLVLALGLVLWAWFDFALWLRRKEIL